MLALTALLVQDLHLDQRKENQKGIDYDLVEEVDALLLRQLLAQRGQPLRGPVHLEALVEGVLEPVIIVAQPNELGREQLEGSLLVSEVDPLKVGNDRTGEDPAAKGAHSVEGQEGYHVEFKC